MAGELASVAGWDVSGVGWTADASGGCMGGAAAEVPVDAAVAASLLSITVSSSLGGAVVTASLSVAVGIEGDSEDDESFDSVSAGEVRADCIALPLVGVADDC